MSTRHDPRHAADQLLKTRIEHPVFAGRLVVTGRRSACQLADREVTIEAPSTLLAALAKKCDGRARTADIVSALAGRWDRSDLARLIDGLAEQGVLCERRDLPRAWWTLVKNPHWLDHGGDSERIAALPQEAAQSLRSAVHGVSYHAVKATPLTTLMGRRVSTRTFSPAPIARDGLFALLWAAYGCADRRTVPSAGGIYPLQVHYVQVRAGGAVDPGVYRLSYLSDGKLGLMSLENDVHALLRCFLDPDGLSHAQGVIVIAGDLGRTAIKYQTRSALYVPLEAGHAAQNVLLAAAENNVAAVEIGGFEEDRLAALLQLSPQIVPLTTIVIGSPPTPEQRALHAGAPEVEFLWTDGAALWRPVPFHIGAARLKGQQPGWSWGRSPDPAIAHAKAVAEAHERWSCTCPGGLVEGRFTDLGDAVLPQDILAYSAAQYARRDFPYAPFATDAKYLWKQGQDIRTGQHCSVLVDFVYFGAFIEHSQPYTSASSSGVAAYTTRQGALERAVLELIERDAFMRTWLERATRPTVDHHSLPSDMIARIGELQRAGVEVTIKDHSLDLASVIFIFAQSVEHGFTLATAASAFAPEEALDTAMMEAEFLVANRLAAGERRKVDPRQVQSPEDHADLYAQRRYFRRADFLGGEGRKIAFADIGRACAGDWTDLDGRLAGRGRSILWFDLTPPGAALHQGRTPLHIGRAIVPGMIPISFGWDQEPLGSLPSALLAAPRRQRSGKTKSPASTLFPHPFV